MKMYTHVYIYIFIGFLKMMATRRMLRMLEELNGFGSVSEIEMVKKCPLQNMSIMFLMFHSRWTNAESEKLAMPTHFLSVRLVSAGFFHLFSHFFWVWNTMNRVATAPFKGRQKEFPPGRSWTWVVCMTLGDHHTYATPNWRRNCMVFPPAGYSLICQAWQTENAGDLEASNFWNTHSQRLRIVAIQMIWQNCMGSGWQSLIGWIFSVAIVSSAVLAAVSGDQIAWMFYH